MQKDRIVAVPVQMAWRCHTLPFFQLLVVAIGSLLISFIVTAVQIILLQKHRDIPIQQLQMRTSSTANEKEPVSKYHVQTGERQCCESTGNNWEPPRHQQQLHAHNTTFSTLQSGLAYNTGSSPERASHAEVPQALHKARKPCRHRSTETCRSYIHSHTNDILYNPQKLCLVP